MLEVFDQDSAEFSYEDEVQVEESDYWGDLGPDEIGQAVLEIRTAHWEFLKNNAYDQRWAKFNSYYYSNFGNIYRPMVPGMTFTGEHGEYATFTVNHLRSILKSSVSSMVANPLSFKTIATNTDTASKEGAEMFQVVMDFYHKEYGLEDAIRKCVEQSLITDAAYLMLEWDDTLKARGIGGGKGQVGDLRITRLSNWDVYFPPLETSDGWTGLPYLITREWVPRRQLMAQFPEKIKDIKAQQDRRTIESNEQYIRRRILLTGAGENNQYMDQIELVKLWHNKTLFMPEGRQVKMLTDGTVLDDNPFGLMYPCIPVKRMVLDEDNDTLLGWSPMDALVSIQELFNLLNESVATNQYNTATQVVAAQAGTNVNPRQIGTFTLLEYNGTNPPQGLNFTKTAPEIFQMIDNLKGEMQQVLGVSNASRGIVGPQQSGSSALFAASQTMQNQSTANTNYERFCSEIGTLLLQILQTFADNPRTISIMGENNRPRMAEISKDRFASFDRVTASIGNPMMNTEQGKMAMAEMLVQYGRITPDEFFEVLRTGRLQVATEPLEIELGYIDEENDALRAGVNPKVVPTDNHELHVSRHRRLLNSIRARVQATRTPEDERMLVALTAHIEEHVAMEAQSKATLSQANVPGAQPFNAGPSLGGPMPNPDADPVASNNPVRQQARSIGSRLPNPPSDPRRG